MLVKLVILLLFFVVTIGVGFYCRKRARSVGDFVLGGRGVGAWLTAFAYGTSYFSAVVFIGYAGQFGWSFGVAAVWIGLGNAFIGSLLAWKVLGRRTRVMSKYFESSTMPDFFEKRYLSRPLKIVSSIIIFVFLVPYSASVYKGLSGLFSMAFGIDFVWCVVGMAVLTAIYVILGGYVAAALNDFIQGIIMLVGIVIVIMAVLGSQGGLIASLEKLSAFSAPAAPAMQGAYISFLGPDPLGLLGVAILTSLGTWGLPQMVHKFYTIKDERAIKTGTIISTLFALIVAGGSYFLGAFGRLFYTPGEGGIQFDAIVPEMLRQSLPDVLVGVVIILVLSASMSTLSALVISSSSTFTLDFLKGLWLKNMRPAAAVSMIKVLCALFILISVLIALNPSSLISTLMSLSWGALAGCFLGPFMYGLFAKKATEASVWACFVSGIGINVLNLFVPFTSPTMAGAISIVASLIVVPVVSLFTKKPDKAFVDKVFSCFEEKVEVPTVVALGDPKRSR